MLTRRTNRAANFGVTVEFLLQMASYLTEHHTSQLRAQMRRATAAKGSSAPSPVPGPEPPTSGVPEAGGRTASGGRAPSSLSTRRGSPLLKNDGSIPESPIRPSLVSRPQGSRKSSSNTAVPTQNATPAKNANTKPGSPRTRRQRLPLPPISTAPVAGAGAPPSRGQSSEPDSPGYAGSSSVASSSSSSPVESRIIRRPPRFQPQEGGGPYEDEEEAEPAFLPYKAPSPKTQTNSQNSQDLVSTVRGNSRDLNRRLSRNTASAEAAAQQSQTSDSSTGSAAMIPRRSTGDRKTPVPLSPRRTAELAGRASGSKGKGYARDGSEGNRSMSSSFSDLEGKHSPIGRNMLFRFSYHPQVLF